MPPPVAEVMYILLDNASKYSPAGHHDSHCRSAPRTTHSVRVSVADEGPGIPPELRERVFEKFFRIPGREPHDPRRAGIGLGLPIARRLRRGAGRPHLDRGAAAAAERRSSLTLPIGRRTAARWRQPGDSARCGAA